MDIRKLIDLYYHYDKNNYSNQYIVFKLEDQSFSVSTLTDETEYLWLKNKDVVISFVTTDKIMHNTMIMYQNGSVEYSNYSFFDPKTRPQFLTHDYLLDQNSTTPLKVPCSMVK